MNDNRRFPNFLAIAIIVALSAGLFATLNGCSGGDSMIGNVVKVFSEDGAPLTAEGSRELGRFNAVFTEYSKEPTDKRQLEHFEESYRRVLTGYVRPVNGVALIDYAIKGVEELKAKPKSVEAPKLVEAALDSMLGSLDPHSSYLNPDEFRELQTSTRGEFGGLGIEVTMENGLVKVVSPIEGTPAERAGLQPGDLITHVDGQPLKDKTLMNAVKRLRGAPDSAVTLTIKRQKKKPFDVNIQRAIIHVRAVRWRTEGDIGYVRLARFTETATADLALAVKKIRLQLGDKLKGYVLDLRNNAGGLLDQSLSISDALLEKGVIVSVRGRERNRGQIFHAEAGDITFGKPVVVLINGGSASAAEIVAGALQENGRAVLMGERSFGKGSVQTITPLQLEGALKLTTQLYYSPKGHAIQARGVAPDIALVAEKKPDDETKRSREADLPGHLETADADEMRSRMILKEKNCPEVGKAKDRPLGCALEYLRAGSTDRFLALVKSKSSS
ncbi:MAG: S41 family peptidase [Rhodospirillales bacterium]